MEIVSPLRVLSPRDAFRFWYSSCRTVAADGCHPLFHANHGKASFRHGYISAPNGLSRSDESESTFANREIHATFNELMESRRRPTFGRMYWRLSIESVRILRTHRNRLP